MKYIYAVLIFAITMVLVSCKNKTNPEAAKTNTETKSATPSLELLWQTDSLLTTCEAVLFDKTTQTIYVSNVNKSPWEKDNNGFISTINTKGEITQLKWIEELSGPKGMAILDGNLYVTDIDRVVKISIKNRIVTNEFFVEDTPQLNDITVSENSVYVSGSNSDAIYQIQKDVLKRIANDTLGRLNGLLHQKEGIYYAASASSNFGIYNKVNNTFKTLTKNIGHGDGIVRLENGDFIVSSWKGQIFYIDAKTWDKTVLLDTRSQNINAADIDYIQATQTLLVPTFFNNRVVAYKLKFE